MKKVPVDPLPAPPIPEKPLNGKRNLQQILKVKNKFIISDSSFTTPNASGQLWFSNMYKVEMKNLKFNKMVNSRALQGGSVHAIDVYSIGIFNSTFVGQSSVLHGGAIFINSTTEGKYVDLPKNEYYFERYKINNPDGNVAINLTFKGCESISGSAMFIQN